MFDSLVRLVLGLVTGIAFGVLLQKGRVAKHGVIVGQLLLRDHTVLKVMLTAVAVGGAGFWVLAAFDLASTDVKPAQMGGILLGAGLFGVGLALLGYCPGTTLAAVGEGQRDAVAGLAGMVTGAFTFVAGFSAFGNWQKGIVDWGEVTLADLTRLSPFLWVGVLLAVSVAVYRFTRARTLTPST